jgi:hypothetical protein
MSIGDWDVTTYAEASMMMPAKPSAFEESWREIAAPQTVLGTQVGGDHYTKCAIQPIEYVWANGLGFSEGNVVKYVTRWKDKGGIKDLRKAAHHINLLIEHAEKQEANGVKYGLQG